MRPGSGKWEFGEAGFLVASRGELRLEMERWIETVLQSVKHDAKCKWLLTGLFQGVVSEHLDALPKDIPKHPVVLSVTKPSHFDRKATEKLCKHPSYPLQVYSSNFLSVPQFLSFHPGTQTQGLYAG